MAKLDAHTRRHLERNITISYCTATLSWSRFFLPVLALFYIASQVTLAQFGVIMGVFTFTIAALTAPAGVLADFIGKKKVLFIARLCYTLEVVVLAFMNGFWPLFVAKIISGLGVAMALGAQEGLLFDTLKRLRRLDEHKKISGRMVMINNLTLTAVMIIGGILFAVNPKLPAIVSLPFMAGLTVATLFLYEPYKQKHELTVKAAYKHLKESAVYAWNNPAVRYLIFYSFALFATLDTARILSSAYFTAIGVPLALIGVVKAGETLLTAIAAQQTHRITKFFSDIRTLQIVGITIICAFALATILVPAAGVAAFWIAAFAWGVYAIATNDYVNHHIPTSHRVTVLSIASLTGALGAAILVPVTSALAQNTTMGLAMTLLAIVALLVYTLAEAVRKAHRVT